MLTACLAIAWALNTSAQAQGPATNPSDARAQRNAQLNPQVEQQRRQAEQEARQSLSQEAIAAILETENAVRALSQNNAREALAAIERATDKLSVLVSRHPAAALLPVELEVEVIDAAPHDTGEIKRIAKLAEDAVDDRDFPAARVLLAMLVSEIRVRTYNLPLATYPIAMRDAARMISENKTQEAQILLRTALNTLAVIDHVTPLPIAAAQVAITEAQSKAQQDKEQAKRLLGVARQELRRAKELGYAGRDPEYAALEQSLDEVERQLDGDQDSRSAFARLKDKVTSFFKRQSETEKKAEVASR